MRRRSSPSAASRPSHSTARRVLAQSELALTCRKLYRQPMDPACFLDHEPDTRWYPEKDYHIMYVSEILGAYQGEL